MIRYRKLAKGAAWTLAIAVSALALTFALLQTGPGLSTLEGAIETALSSPEQRVEIEGLKGRVPDRLTINQVTISDATGPWLSAQDISLDWRPSRLFGGLLHVDHLTAAGLSLARLPQGDQTQDTSPAPLAVPSLPIAVRVDRLAVNAIDLQAPVIGSAAQLRLRGALSTQSDTTVEANLTLERTDGPLGSISLKSGFNLADRTLDIDTQIHEAPGGLIAQMLALPGQPEVDLSLTGRGPIADWHGRLTANSGDVASLETDLTIAARERVSFSATGRTDLNALVPSTYRTLLDPALTFSFGGVWDPSAEILRLDEARLGNEVFDIAAKGDLTTDLQNVTVVINASAQGEHLSPLTGPLTLEKIDLEIDLNGPLAALETQFSASAHTFVLDPVSAAQVSIVGAISTKEHGSSGIPLLNIAATIDTNGFTSSVPAAAGLLGARPSAFVAVDIDLARGLITANDARITGDAIDLAAQGSASLDGATMALTLETAIKDLARLPVGPSVGLKGNARVVTEVKAQRSAITATIRGHATKFSSGIAILDSLVDERLDLGATLAGAPGQPWQIGNITLETQHASIRGALGVAANFDAIEATYTANLPTLQPLAKSLDVDLSGRLDSEGELNGPLNDLAFTGKVNGIDLTLAGETLPRASLAVKARDLTTEPQGSFGLDAAYSGAAASAQGQFKIGPETIAFSAIEAEGPGFTASGNLAIPTGNGTIAGTLRADAFDLRTLSAVFGQTASGQARATINLGQIEGKPSLQANLDATQLMLNLDGQRFTAASVTASGDTAYGNADGGMTGSVQIAELAAPFGTLTDLTVAADGTVQDLQFRADAKGNINGDTDLSVEGGLKRPTGQTIVSLAQLGGQLAGQSVKLIAPTRLQFGKDGLILDPVQLELAGGEVTAQSAINDRRVAGRVAFNHLPTSLLAIGGIELPLSGAIDGELDVQGTPRQPQATLSAKGNGLQFQPDRQAPPVPVELSLAATLQDNRLTFEMNGADGDYFSLTAHGQAPVRISAAPFALSPIDDGAVTGELEFSGDVAIVEKMVPIDPHRISGRLQARTTLGGTVAKPIVTGNVKLEDGTYENIEIGTLFENLNANIEFLDGRATVQAKATDGASGNINLNGTVDLAQPQSIDLVLRMANVTLVRRDEVVAALSGDIIASGGFDDLLVSGEVETNTIEVRLIDALPPEIVHLDVEEVGLGRTGSPAPPPDTKDAFAARLEIGVTIPKQLFVRGRGLDSEWQGNLRVSGTTADTEVTGTLSAVRGQFSFAGKTFKLAKGTIAIDEQDGALAALLDVQTEFTDDDFVANVNVTGSATKPEIALSSTPELPHDEVLARILFGRSTGQLSAIEALQLASAAASLSGVGGSSVGLLDKVRDTLGVDVLQVNGGEGDAGPTVSAGKYVADGVFIGAKQGAGPGASAATVEIELTPNISLESEVGQTGRSRAGVNWQFNY